MRLEKAKSSIGVSGAAVPETVCKTENSHDLQTMANESEQLRAPTGTIVHVINADDVNKSVQESSTEPMLEERR